MGNRRTTEHLQTRPTLSSLRADIPPHKGEGEQNYPRALFRSRMKATKAARAGGACRREG